MFSPLTFESNILDKVLSVYFILPYCLSRCRCFPDVHLAENFSILFIQGINQWLKLETIKRSMICVLKWGESFDVFTFWPKQNMFDKATFAIWIEWIKMCFSGKTLHLWIRSQRATQLHKYVKIIFHHYERFIWLSLCCNIS